MTGVRELLARATHRLAEAGVDTPRVDAELLLSCALDLPRGRLLGAGDPDDDAARRYDTLIERRSTREPLQHITGTAAFRYVELVVGPGVFIPRPETELLVDAVLDHLSGLAAPVAVDLCAGSGALAVALADELPAARVIAVERDPSALAWLRRNASGTAVEVIVADVADPEPLGEFRALVDAVVANPPYVPDSTPTSPEVRADPHQAVFGGADGLDVMAAVIARGAELLRPGGRFAVEHDPTQETAVPALFDRARWSGVQCRRDLTGRPRYTVAVRRGVVATGV